MFKTSSLLLAGLVFSAEAARQVAAFLRTGAFLDAKLVPGGDGDPDSPV